MRVLELASLELRRYRRGKLGRAAVVAMILLPLLYGTVYLVAFWNPYNNLDRTPAVIVNEDVPTTTGQGQEINAGAQLEQQLSAVASTLRPASFVAPRWPARSLLERDQGARAR